MTKKAKKAEGSEPIAWLNEKRKVSELRDFESNPRKISERDAEELGRSLEKFGLADVPVIQPDGMLIGGHQRVAILRKRGRDQEIDVRVASRQLTKQEFRELNLRLNRNQGEWDRSKLAAFDLSDLVGAGFDEGDAMANLGLGEAEASLVDPERFDVLMVMPPESPRLRERAEIHFDDIKQYDLVKKAVEDGKITAKDLIVMVKK